MKKILTLMLASVAMLFQAISPAHALLAMRITSVKDLTYTSWSIGDGAINGYMDLCMHTAGIIPAGGYRIQVTSDTGAFVLKDGSKQLPFSLYWNDGGAGNVSSGLGTQMSNGVTLTGRMHGNILDNECVLTGPNARLNLNITDAAMTAAVAGTYKSTLTLLVSPY